MSSGEHVTVLPPNRALASRVRNRLAHNQVAAKQPDDLTQDQLGTIEQNVRMGERLVSLAGGTIITAIGLSRKGLPGLTIAGIGGALALRGITGRCPIYRTLGINTTRDGETVRTDSYIRVCVSYLINKSPETLYEFWRNLENLPQFMTHLESVKKIDERRSHWKAKAPSIYGGTVEWDAEITDDEPNSRIRWKSAPGSDVQHQGSVKFVRALGDRGTNVRVELEFHPPAGTLGRWLAKLFGEEPEQQIRDDLRKFKRMMELGEIPTTVGQPQGTCRGSGETYSE